jgi:hypothetical protein
MKKSQLTTETIGTLQKAIEIDLDWYEEGGRQGFVFLIFVEDVGMLVSNEWIEQYPDWKDQWGKFMEGQTCCPPGFYVRDVNRFLNIKLKELGNEK